MQRPLNRGNSRPFNTNSRPFNASRRPFNANGRSFDVVPIIPFILIAIFGIRVLVDIHKAFGISNWYYIVSIITFVVYFIDKDKAERGEWRTSEIFLHILALSGGWPGALAAMPFADHKWKKFVFMIVFALTIFGNWRLIYRFHVEKDFATNLATNLATYN
ncbi:hypothetical protein Ddc_12953 [Ditylenchus destructor]|nr:hypothetical protein Ddc_12953 [Ditylenchus destructor]